MQKIVLLSGEAEVVGAATCMIQHLCSFSLKSLYNDKNDSTKMLWELTIDDDHVPETAYEVALVQFSGAQPNRGDSEKNPSGPFANRRG